MLYCPKYLVGCWLLSGWIAVLCQPASAESFRVGMPEDLKPYTFLEAGAWRGIDLEITRTVYKKLGIEPTYVPMPWARQLRLAERGILDAITTVYCEEDSTHLHIAGETLYTVVVALFTQTGKNLDEKPSEAPEPGSSVGIVRENFLINLLENRAELAVFPANSTPLLVEQLAAGRLDYVLEERLPFLHYARDQGHSAKVKEHAALKQINVCMAFSTNSDYGFDQAFFDRVNRILGDLKAAGTIDKIISSYID